MVTYPTHPQERRAELCSSPHSTPHVEICTNMMERLQSLTRTLLLGPVVQRGVQCRMSQRGPMTSPAAPPRKLQSKQPPKGRMLRWQHADSFLFMPTLTRAAMCMRIFFRFCMYKVDISLWAWDRDDVAARFKPAGSGWVFRVPSHKFLYILHSLCIIFAHFVCMRPQESAKSDSIERDHDGDERGWHPGSPLC